MISRHLLLLLWEDYEKHAFVEAALGGRLGLEASSGRCGLRSSTGTWRVAQRVGYF